MNTVPDESLPFGDPPLIEHPTPNGVTEIGQRLIPFPFTPPDVRLDDKEALQPQMTGSPNMTRRKSMSSTVWIFTRQPERNA